MLTPHENEHFAKWTTASQLAEMGFCERKVLLRHLYGNRTSSARRQAQAIGTKEHRRFLHSAFNEQPAVITSIKRPQHSNTKIHLSALQRVLRLLQLALRNWSARRKRSIL